LKQPILDAESEAKKITPKRGRPSKKSQKSESEEYPEEQRLTIGVLLDFIEDKIENLKPLLNVNPPKVGGLADFSYYGEKLFTLENFSLHLQPELAYSSLYMEEANIFISSDIFKNKETQKKNIEMIPETSDILRRVKMLVHILYTLTLNSLTQLSNIVEIAKAKSKDSFHFFKALEELVDAVNMFYGDSMTCVDEKKETRKFTSVFFSDLLSDSFLKNIEACIKSESDLKLNIVRLNPIYEMTLVHKFFNAAGKGSISGTTMLRKIDRHAEKNSSAIYQFAYLDGLMKIFKYMEVVSVEEITADVEKFKKKGVVEEKKFFEFMENWIEDYSKNKKIADLMKMKATGRLLKTEGF